MLERRSSDKAQRAYFAVVGVDSGFYNLSFAMAGVLGEFSFAP